MNNKFKNKKIALYIAIFILLIGGSFLIYSVINADNNNVEFKKFSISSIITGSGSFENDGNDYSNNDSINLSSKNIIPGFEGKDGSPINSLVRSFDKLVYGFSYTLYDENNNEYYDSSALTVRVLTSFDEALDEVLVVDDSNCSKLSASRYECLFKGKELLEDSGSYEDSITFKVLNAPNGTLIDPKFEISVLNSSKFTNNSIVLGNIDGTNHNYELKNGSYNTLYEGVNPMPTVVTSKESNYTYELIPSPISQLSNYNGETGRYMTYILGIKYETENGIKGRSYPTNDFNFNVTTTQANGLAMIDPSFIRLYGSEEVGNLLPVIMNLPYSTSSTNDIHKYLKNPGILSATGDNNSYSVNLSSYIVGANIPTIGADNKNLDTTKPYLSTIAITVFSGRTFEDGNNEIDNYLNITGDINISASSKNKYEITGDSDNTPATTYDYSLSSAFYMQDEVTPLSLRLGGAGSISKGSTVKYKTKFNYKKAASNQGLKEIIKLDTNAYRVVPYNGEDEQVKIKVMCGNSECDGISAKDFEVKYVSGDFTNSNYSLVTNFENSKMSPKNQEIASNKCSQINLGSLSVDEVQNLYGGPCILANKNVEQTFNSIYDAKYETAGSDRVVHENETPITKVVISTKEGVVLPDNCTVETIVSVRVRNISDLSQNYQMTTIALTSDYDNELYYYAPKVDLFELSATNPKNYVKSTYAYNYTTGTKDFVGDDLKIVNYTARQNMTVTNKNADGSTKVNYRTTKNETITYEITTNIDDFNEEVGGEDVWFITRLKVYVDIPSELEYIKDNDLIKPSDEYAINNGIRLVYELPYTKPNMKIPKIYFKAKLSPKISGTTKEIKVVSRTEALNFNDETDTSVIRALGSSFTIYGTGVNEVIGEMLIGKEGSVVEKDSEFSYVITAYNNTGFDVIDYSIIDILPYNDKNETNNEGRNSKFNGKYSVKLDVNRIENAKIMCSTTEPNKIAKHIKDLDNENNNIWIPCDEIIEDYMDDITAIKIDDLSIEKDSYMEGIVLHIKPKNNKYSDMYNNDFIGKTSKSEENISNTIGVSVVSRKISGSVFIDKSGMGVKDGNEEYVPNVPVTLFKIDKNNKLVKVSETNTDENGKYLFEDLDVGRYKIRSNYDTSKYDLTLRYATEDVNKDSDAYKIDDKGTVEISNKSENTKGILLSKTELKAENMDVGLLLRQSFGFDMKKYITKIDLTNDGILDTKLYNNESNVVLSVINPNRFYAKVSYGIAIKNISSKAGYVTLVEENIPSGMIFDKNIKENEGWFEVHGVVQTDKLKDTLIKPGETVYLQIVLLLPERNEAGTFINEVSVLEMKEYMPPELTEDKDYYNPNSDKYAIGDKISYAGVDWHIVNIALPKLTCGIYGCYADAQVLTLLADSGTIPIKMSHLSNKVDSQGIPLPYKWSESNIRAYLNNTDPNIKENGWLKTNNIDHSKLIDDYVCDDASGLRKGTYGGIPNSLNKNGCYSELDTLSKVRLLTREEFDIVTKTSLNDYSWLYGNKDYWLMNAIDSELVHNVYGVNTNAEVTHLAAYVDSSNNRYGAKPSSESLEVRPVIEIASFNIIPE